MAVGIRSVVGACCLSHHENAALSHDMGSTPALTHLRLRPRWLAPIDAISVCARLSLPALHQHALHCEEQKTESAAWVFLSHRRVACLLNSALFTLPISPLLKERHFFLMDAVFSRRRVARLLNSALFTFQGGFDRQLREALGPLFPEGLLPSLAGGASAAIQVGGLDTGRPWKRRPVCSPRTAWCFCWHARAERSYAMPPPCDVEGIT